MTYDEKLKEIQDRNPRHTVVGLHLNPEGKWEYRLALKYGQSILPKARRRPTPGPEQGHSANVVQADFAPKGVK